MKYRTLGTLLIIILASYSKCEAVIAFLNDRREVVFLDLEERKILDRESNPAMVASFENVMTRGYYNYFDMELWRKASGKLNSDFITYYTWGDEDYFVYRDGIIALKGNQVFGWRQFLDVPAGAEFKDLFIYEDTMMVATDSATVYHSVCDTLLGVDDRTDGVLRYIFMEPFFIIKQYTDGLLSISSVYHPRTDYFLVHDFRDRVLDYAHIQDMFILTSQELYKINPILRLTNVVLRPSQNVRFRAMHSRGTYLYILTSDQSIIAYNTFAKQVEAITTLDALIGSIGVDEKYVYANVGSEIYCFDLENLEVHHVIKLENDRPRGTMLTVMNYQKDASER